MSDLLVAFTIPGEPLPKGRPRTGKGRVFTPAKTREYEAHVRNTFQSLHPGFVPTEHKYLLVEAEFHRTTRRPADVDNLLKAVTDALNGIAYRDDEQISRFTVARTYGARENARTEVRIHTL
ncbi:RusA family crossover junction endodeoxyribonuclease [Clavibacter michiganensis]|uniref:RusA family crossover junction endodeoxyribonuclease n=1 Tax=Clavibacter michiganensis TaxID=28447 RepID=UPI0015E415FE|nr:RusA family crossover junction endodeoxyribonuclease [Clavibacter michiganensis]